MDLTVTALLSALLTLVALAVLRSVRTGRRRLIVLIPVLLALVLVRWASYRQAWAELALAVAVSGLTLLLWWFVYGRRLPPPSDDNIRVWTKDDPF